MDREEAKSVLAQAVQSVQNKADVDATLQQRKREAEQWRARNDVLWFEIVLSLSTQGRSGGDVLATDEENFQKVRYEKVQSMEESERPEHFERVLRDVGIRFPNQKAKYLSRNVERLDEKGGPAAAWEQFEATEGKEAKIAFLKQFHGIGPKYARNIPMDLHLPEFRDSIALDERLKGISEDLGLEFETYEDGAEFYRSVARELGMTPWELDRTLYNQIDAIKAELESD